jgi:hypothetical protein
MRIRWRRGAAPSYDLVMADGSAGVEDDDLGSLTGWYSVPGGRAQMGYVVEVGPDVLAIAAGVPEQVEISGEALAIEPFLWRDFMPGPGRWTDGSELRAGVRVKGSTPGVFPPVLRPEWFAVVHGSLVWMATGVIESLSAGNTDHYEVMARNGPQWGPDVLVDVIVQFRDRHGCAYRMRASDVRIDRTE